MKFGLKKSQYQFILEKVVQPLEALGAVVWCYGSRARGNAHKFSDLDLMVESNKDLSSKISFLKEMLTQSHFPFKVDIVELSQFAESYQSSFYKDRIRFSQKDAIHKSMRSLKK